MLECIKIGPGEEVIRMAEKHLAKRGVSHGAIVSVIGAVDSCCISNMPKNNAKEDILKEYKEPFEMSGNGEIVDGKVHIHCSLGQEGNRALSGHLHWAKVENWYVHLYFLRGQNPL